MLHELQKSYLLEALQPPSVNSSLNLMMFVSALYGLGRADGREGRTRWKEKRTVLFPCQGVSSSSRSPFSLHLYNLNNRLSGHLLSFNFFKNVFILREVVSERTTTQSHNPSSNTLFLWWFYLLTCSCPPYSSPVKPETRWVHSPH